MMVDSPALSAACTSDGSSPFLLFFDLAQLSPMKEPIVTIEQLDRELRGISLALHERALHFAHIVSVLLPQPRPATVDIS
jgi:hypothetical protein